MLCWIVSVSLALHVPHSTMASCTTALDCSLAGLCISGRCKCDPGWTGQDCNSLSVSPNATTAVSSVNRTVWGGHAAFDSSDGVWHWLGGVYQPGAPLSAWEQSELAGHASQTTHGSPAGRFALDQIVLEPSMGGGFDNGSIGCPYLVHNPRPWRNQSDTWLLFYTGYAAVPDPAHGRKVGVAYAASLQGPWTKWGTPVFEPGRAGSWDSSSVSAVGPYVLQNGTVMLSYKGLGSHVRSDPHRECTDGSGRPCTGVAIADHWSGPYLRLTESQLLDTEDTSIFPSASSPGGWHMVYHCLHCAVADCKGDCSAMHAFSVDGRTWKQQLSLSRGWHGLNRTMIDGTPRRLIKRERPQVVVDPTTLRPIVMFTGVVESGREYPYNIVNEIK